MQAEFSFDSKAVEQFLDRVGKNLNNIKGAERRFVDTLSQVVFGDIIQHFEQEEGEDGPWLSWSDMYAEHMTKIGKGGNNILQDTGRLRQSFFPSNYRKGSGGIEWFNPAKTEDGFPYAYAHDEGGPRLPKRNFMWLSMDALDRISIITLEFLKAEGNG